MTGNPAQSAGFDAQLTPGNDSWPRAERGGTALTFVEIRSDGRLPAENELVDQLRKAGLNKVKAKNLLPGGRFLAFQAFRG